MKYCHIHSECLVIRLPGEIDHQEADRIRRECDVMFMKTLVRDIIFDFSETEFMDSSGIGLLIGRVRQVKPVKGNVYIYGEKTSIKSMCDMSGIFSLVKELKTMEEVKEVYE